MFTNHGTVKHTSARRAWILSVMGWIVWVGIVLPTHQPFMEVQYDNRLFVHLSNQAHMQDTLAVQWTRTAALERNYI